MKHPSYSTYIAKRTLIKGTFIVLALCIFILLVVWPYYKSSKESTSNFVKPLLGTALKMMQGVQFYGMTSKGESYTVNSQKIIQKNPQDFLLNNIEIVLKNIDNQEMQITACEGLGNTKDKGIELSKGVCIKLQDGSVLQTSSAALNLEKGLAQGQDIVQGKGPLGTLQAGGFEIKDKGKTIRFIKRVKVRLVNSSRNKPK